MIFITLGSQKFQQNRILKEVDLLIKNNQLEEKIIAQIGYSDYKPMFFDYYKFIDQEKYKEVLSESSIVLTHGGTGAIISALKNKKKVIAVPRLSYLGEHVDDHQLQIVKQFEEMNLIISCIDINDLTRKIKAVNTMNFNEYKTSTTKVISSIDSFLTKEYNK